MQQTYLDSIRGNQAAISGAITLRFKQGKLPLLPVNSCRGSERTVGCSPIGSVESRRARSDDADAYPSGSSRHLPQRGPKYP